MLSAYTAQTLRDGVVGKMYRLTMRDATQVYPRCTLVKSSTRTPHAVGKVTLTVSGMDNGLDDSLEFVGTSDYNQYSSGDLIVKYAPRMAAKVMKSLAGQPPIQATFGSLRFGKSVNPSSPMSPLSQAVRSFVDLECCNKSGWIVGFVVKGKVPSCLLGWSNVKDC